MPPVFPKSFGLLRQDEIIAKDWRLGAVSGAEKHVLRADGQYLGFLPRVEYQSAVYFDTMACVTFSALNCLEIILKVHEVEIDKSDRFTARMSNTTRTGNYLRSVAESIRVDGTVEESSWPFPRMQRQPVFGWEEYYQLPDPAVIMEGKRWLVDWNVEWEWVPATEEKLKEAMTYGPVQVCVYAWPKPKDGLYDDGGNKDRNHAVTLVGYEEGKHWWIFDHYDAALKKLVWAYDFQWALRYSLTKKHSQNNFTPMPTIVLPDDVLVQETEVSGQFGLHLNGRILLGDLAETLATWLMRNKGVVDGRCIPLKKSDFDSFPKFDLKNNPL